MLHLLGIDLNLISVLVRVYTSPIIPITILLNHRFHVDQYDAMGFAHGRESGVSFILALPDEDFDVIGELFNFRLPLVDEVPRNQHEGVALATVAR